MPAIACDATTVMSFELPKEAIVWVLMGKCIRDCHVIFDSVLVSDFSGGKLPDRVMTF